MCECYGQIVKSDGGDGAPQTLQTVERALNFLEFVASSSTPPTARQVADGLGLNITTCYHLMRTLLSRGYLDRRDNGTLRLGRSVGSLFRAYQLGFNVTEHLSSVIVALTERTAETSFLSTLEDRNVILRALVEGSQPLRVGGLYVGLTGNELKRASGKAILAHADSAVQHAVIERYRAEAAPRPAAELTSQVLTDLAKVREDGWAIDADHSPGIVSIGAPFFDHDGTVVGAVGIVAPSTRWEENRTRLLEAVLDAAKDATNRLIA